MTKFCRVWTGMLGVFFLVCTSAVHRLRDLPQHFLKPLFILIAPKATGDSHHSAASGNGSTSPASVLLTLPTRGLVG